VQDFVHLACSEAEEEKLGSHQLISLGKKSLLFKFVEPGRSKYQLQGEHTGIQLATLRAATARHRHSNRIS